MGKHKNHICPFNDGKQSCDCYDAGYEAGAKDYKESMFDIVDGYLEDIKTINKLLDNSKK